jgi:hypothetical protein
MNGLMVSHLTTTGTGLLLKFNITLLETFNKVTNITIDIKRLAT